MVISRLPMILFPNTGLALHTLNVLNHCLFLKVLLRKGLLSLLASKAYKLTDRQTDRQADICLPNSGNRLNSEAVKITAQKKNCQNKYRNIKTSSLSNFQLHFSMHYDPKYVRAMFQCLSQKFLEISSMIDHKSFSDSLLVQENDSTAF